MDITLLFKACVKTMRTRNRAFGVISEGDKNRILRTQQKSEFSIKAKEVVSQITRLRDFLIEHRKAYMNFARHLSDTPQMTDFERDQIDAGAQRIMNTCSHLIQNFKRESVDLDGSPQLLEHRQAVFQLVESYLKTVCKIYSEQKVIRVKRALEMQKLWKLEFDEGKVYGQSMSDRGILNESVENNIPKTLQESINEEKCDNKKIETPLSIGDDFLPECQLSAEEIQMFETENELLYNSLNTLSDEVRQIEGKVVRIAELQEIFTEKVLQQEKDIDRILDTVVGSTENVKDANEQIRQAIQRNVGLRFWILFFLLLMSMSLLFLDWYND